MEKGNSKEDIKKALDKVKADKVKFVKLVFTDIMGMIKSVTIPVEVLPESLERGTWFDGSSIEGFTRIAESDMYLLPDPATYVVLPWMSRDDEATARFICDVYTPDGKPFEGDPRYILKKALAEAKALGYEFNVGPELEFFLFKTDGGKIVPTPHDAAGYFDYEPRDMASDVRRDIVLALQKMGIEVEASHHEVAEGQHEIDTKYGEALKTADNTITFKYTVKSIAHAHGLHATFMPKPIFGINGSGMHVHQSFFSSTTKKNVFFDANDKYKLSPLAKSFIAGQLKHARSIASLVAPTVNSYKRLVPGYEAPVYICWASTNRSALIRIPRYSEGKESATRAELRCPDPSCNPYLAFAGMLYTGLDGIKNKMVPPESTEEDVYDFDESKLVAKGIGTLPASLYEAIMEFKNSALMKDKFGGHFYTVYIEAKKKEWDSFRIQVTPWELEMYLEKV